MMAVASSLVTRQEHSDGRVEPSTPAHDRGHDGPQPVAGDATILPARGGEVQPVLRALAGPAGPGGRAGVPGPPGADREVVGGAEPAGVRSAVLLRPPARARSAPGTASLRAPDRLCLEDVRAFQVHLVSTGMSWAALNQTVCALRFFYGVTLGHGEIPERIPYAREPRKLPVVLSADEVVRFLEAVASLKSRAALTTAYAAGLRASEVVGLKVANIDSARMVIRVEHGKGGEDQVGRAHVWT